jgi:hypothetical protein
MNKKKKKKENDKWMKEKDLFLFNLSFVGERIEWMNMIKIQQLLIGIFMLFSKNRYPYFDRVIWISIDRYSNGWFDSMLSMYRLSRTI